MSYNINDYIKLLKDPYHTKYSDWKKWKDWFGAWKKNRLYGLNAAERDAKAGYEKFTTQSRNQYSKAVKQLRRNVEADALRRGISRSTIPGALIGSETDRMSKIRDKNELAAKTGLEQAIDSIRAGRRNVANLADSTDKLDKTFESLDAVDGNVAEDENYKVDYSVLGDMVQAGERVEDIIKKNIELGKQQEVLDKEKEKKDLEKEQERQRERQKGYDEGLKAWLKDMSGIDGDDYDLIKNEDTLGNRLYWNLKDSYNSIVDLLKNDFDRDNQRGVDEWKAFKNNLDRIHEEGFKPADAAALTLPSFDIANELKSRNLLHGEKLGENVKGFFANYKKAAEEENKRLTGVDAPYEKIVIPHFNWARLGCFYDMNDPLDKERYEKGYPPKSYLDKFTDTPEDQKRRQEGRLPKVLEDALDVVQDQQNFIMDYQSLLQDADADLDDYQALVDRYASLKDQVNLEQAKEALRGAFAQYPGLQKYLADLEYKLDPTGRKLDHGLLERNGFDVNQGFIDLNDLKDYYEKYIHFIQSALMLPARMVYDKSEVEDAFQKKYNEGYEKAVAQKYIEKYGDNPNPDHGDFGKNLIESLKSGNKLSQIDAYTGRPMKNLLTGEVFSSNSLSTDDWAKLFLDDDEIKRMKVGLFGYNPGEIRPFIPGIDDKDVEEWFSVSREIPLQNIIRILTGQQIDESRARSQQATMNMERDAYIERYDHLPPNDPASKLTANPWLNNPVSQVIWGFADSGSSGIPVLMARGITLMQGENSPYAAVLNALDRTESLHPGAKRAGDKLGTIFAVTMLNSTISEIIKGLPSKFFRPVIKEYIKGAGSFGTHTFLTDISNAVPVNEAISDSALNALLSGFVTAGMYETIGLGRPNIPYSNLNESHKLLMKGKIPHPAEPHVNQLARYSDIHPKVKGNMLDIIRDALRRSRNTLSIIPRNSEITPAIFLEPKPKKYLAGISNRYTKPKQKELGLVHLQNISTIKLSDFHNTGILSNNRAKTLTALVKTHGFNLKSGDIVALHSKSGRLVNISLVDAARLPEITKNKDISEIIIFKVMGVGAGGKKLVYKDITNFIFERARMQEDLVNIIEQPAGNKEVNRENINISGIRAYTGVEANGLPLIFLANPRYVVEMEFKGIGLSRTNAAGWERNSTLFFATMLDKHPEIWSDANVIRIENGTVPVVDEVFTTYFQQYREYLGDHLIHHHIGGGGQAYAIPESLHSGFGGVHKQEKVHGIWGKDKR